MLQCQLPRRPPPPPPPHLPSLAVTRAASTTTVSFSRGAASHGRSRIRRAQKRKPIAFPPPPIRRVVSTALRRLLLLPRQRTLAVLLGGGRWFGLGTTRRTTPAEEFAALALSLALGGKLAVLADSWNASGLGQALGVLAAVWRRGERRRGGLRRLAAFLLGIAFCAIVCHWRGAAFVNGLARTAGGRKLARIFLH
ncbi:hypothetical protein GUJ93_ZPchr0007g5182 [Zizania palustris]|uniref:Uncharacterized protein n=1 Tax=Zizania palustris TaxID=103762 RepID=A0A8J5W4Z6_ZIZPA|nr:hypothetical protein GUJ93_ZPchr0007g5182 [Zizania palustris]